MDHLVGLRAFVAAAREGSFAASGRALGLTRDQVSKAMAELERRVRTPLFARSTRNVQLTAAGATYLERVTGVLRALDEADELLHALDATPCGTLVVHGPASFGVAVMAPLSAAFLDSYDQIALELRLDDRLLDQLPPDVDVVVRVTAQPPSHLAAEALGQAARGLFASPAYLARAGEPLRPEDVLSHALVHYAGLASGKEWVLARGKDVRRFEVAPRFASSAGMAVAAAAIGGVGIAMLPDFLAAPARARGELVRVLPRWAPPALQVFAITQAARQSAPKIRAYVDHLRAGLAARSP